ncbi:MAG: hypothetical protein LUQ41_01040 [Methanomicrobiales archaeon]|nr:hypothetical protein [Methanomicrobiales archaeon]
MFPVRYALLSLVLLALVLPAAAAATSSEGYLNVDRVAITLDGADAQVRMEYNLAGGMRILVYLLGTRDLERKVKRVLNFEGARVEEIDTSHALVRVEDAAVDYGDGTYWFPEHRFGVTVPLVTVKTPQYTQAHRMSVEIPRGIGYYRV